MPDANSWWASKLGGGAPAQQRQAPAPRQQAPYAPPPPQQFAQPPAPQAPAEYDEQGNAIIRAGEAWQHWQGTEAARQNTGNCPQCRSSNYFSRVDPTKPTRGPAPMPQCGACGFPVVQAGSPSGDLAGAKASAGGRARQADTSGDLPMFTVVDRVV